MKRISTAMVCIAFIYGAAGCHRVPATSRLPEARFENPTDAIVRAFQDHQLVAIADDHGNEQVHAFRLALLKEPRLTSLINDIVVEFGSARYQGTMDDYVGGKDVPYPELRHVWQDTTQVEYDWELPIYAEFFRAIRDLNVSLPKSRQIRVLLGDRPIDWTKVHSSSDLPRPVPGAGSAYVVDLIKREILDKNRRALIVYGTQHLIRKNAVPNAADDWAKGLVAQLERPGTAKVYTVYPETHADLQIQQPSVASWPIPSLAVLHGTILGASLFWPEAGRRVVKVEDQFDAILYLGAPSTMTMSHLPPTLCADSEYMTMRLGRMALVPPPPGAPITESEMLKSYCAKALLKK